MCRTAVVVAAALLATVSGLSIKAAQAQQQAGQGQFTFDISAKPVPQAVNDVGRVTGLSVVFRENRPISAQANPVRGSMSAEQAMTTLLAGTGLAFSFSNPTTVQVFEQPSAGPASSEARAPGTVVLDTVVIYGARNATTLDATTASVGIVTGQELQDSQIRTTQDAYRRLANVQNSATVNSGFVIRGMSSEGFVPGGAPVGSLYVDGILQTRYNSRFGARNLWDVEQVEVYRGPQSTLSGRAAMSGAIYVKSKDPTFEREVELSGTVGTNNLLGTGFVVNTPVVEDQVALRISGAFERSRPDVSYSNFNHYSGYDDLINDISGTIRAKLLLTPSELPDTRALLTYTYSKDRPNDRLVGLYSGRGDFNNNPDTYTEYRWTEVHNLGLEVTHDLSDSLRLTSQTGFQYGINNRRSVDSDTPGYVTGIWGTDDDYILTQEVRLNYEGDRWKWVAGAFASHQVYDGSSLFVAEAYPDYMPGSIFQLQDYQRRTTSNAAIFGEATYEFADSWFVTAGGRVDYLKEKNTELNSLVMFGMAPEFSPPDGTAAFDELNFVPKVSLSKEFGENHTIGLTYSQGFRSGGSYVNRSRAPIYTIETYDPEYSQSYELSYKGRLLEDQLTLNANLFYTKYDDQQIEVRPRADIPGYRVTENAASSRAWGMEIEPTWQVNEAFSAFASIGYLNTKFLQFNHQALSEDQSGKSFPEAPEWSLGFGGKYEFANGVFIGADAKYTSDYNSRFGTGGMYKIDDRFLVNAQVGFRKENFEITAFVENLTDEKYFTIVDPDAALPFGQAGLGRSFGLNVRTKF